MQRLQIESVNYTAKPIVREEALMKLTSGSLVAVLYCLAAPALIHAATVPFTEEFTTTVSNWADNSAMNLLNYVSSGGPDGGSYASASTALSGTSMVLFRAQDEFNSSSHALEGNWVADGVGEFSAFVRHNAPLPLTYFGRFSGPGNFPGGTAVKFAPVLPGAWTQLKFIINPGNPEFVTFEGSSFATVFSNVGHVQLGVTVPAALAGNMTQYTFDIDKASIAALVPEPSALSALVFAGMHFAFLRRRVI
jgi:hypothetical protein